MWHRMPIDLDLYFPVFTVLQFFFFMGLLKVTDHHDSMMEKNKKKRALGC